MALVNATLGNDLDSPFSDSVQVVTRRLVSAQSKKGGNERKKEGRNEGRKEREKKGEKAQIGN